VSSGFAFFWFVPFSIALQSSFNAASATVLLRPRPLRKDAAANLTDPLDPARFSLSTCSYSLCLIRHFDSHLFSLWNNLLMKPAATGSFFSWQSLWASETLIPVATSLLLMMPRQPISFSGVPSGTSCRRNFYNSLLQMAPVSGLKLTWMIRTLEVSPWVLLKEQTQTWKHVAPICCVWNITPHRQLCSQREKDVDESYRTAFPKS
jgi:hypothetical protein